MGFGKDGTGAIIRERIVIVTGTLASATAILSTSGGVGAMQEDFRILKSEITVQVENSVGDESVMIGLANGELSIGEIAQCLNVDGPVDRNDRLAVEQAERAVWTICNAGNASRLPNDGLPIEFKPRWTFSDPEAWNFFAFNQSETALGTSMTVTMIVKHFGVWVT